MQKKNLSSQETPWATKNAPNEQYFPLHTCFAEFIRQTKSKTHTDYFQTLQCYDIRDECFSKAFDYVKEKSGTTTLSFFMMTRS